MTALDDASFAPYRIGRPRLMARSASIRASTLRSVSVGSRRGRLAGRRLGRSSGRGGRGLGARRLLRALLGLPGRLLRSLLRALLGGLLGGLLRSFLLFSHGVAPSELGALTRVTPALL